MYVSIFLCVTRFYSHALSRGKHLEPTLTIPPLPRSKGEKLAVGGRWFPDVQWYNKTLVTLGSSQRRFSRVDQLPLSCTGSLTLLCCIFTHLGSNHTTGHSANHQESQSNACQQCQWQRSALRFTAVRAAPQVSSTAFLWTKSNNTNLVNAGDPDRSENQLASCESVDLSVHRHFNGCYAPFTNPTFLLLLLPLQDSSWERLVAAASAAIYRSLNALQHDTMRQEPERCCCMEYHIHVTSSLNYWGGNTYILQK